ncbi:hypothetical protein ABZS76_33035 [Streptomyces sp. NPDC005562]|uniref:hypothetical protein n=1 Tax=Streptomyces sp. NPDC005562 TaxID=3154890 RepID=UPI00339E5E62
MDYTSLLWEEATRDADAEQLDLARTSALADAERMLGPLVFQAVTAEDLGHRLALAEPHLLAIAERRGYSAGELAADLGRQWKLLAEARTHTAAETAQRTAASRKVTAAQEQQMDAAVAALAALAARENPLVPMSECLRMATEAVQKKADAFPLAYESWGGTADGPFTDRLKRWKPPALPGAAAAPNSGDQADPGMFDDVNKRLDGLEERVGRPSGPSGPASPTASLDPMIAGFMERVRNWWNRGHEPQHTAPAPTATPAPAAGKHWSEDDKATLQGLDRAQHEMSQKWDANAAAPGASAEYTSHHPAPGSDLLSGFDKARDTMNEKWDANAAAPGASSGFVPSQPEFSHAAPESGTMHQDTLPTDPYPEFSHPSSHQRALPATSTPAPTHFSG